MMFLDALELAGKLLTPLVAVKNALENINDIEEKSPFLGAKVDIIQRALDRIVAEKRIAESRWKKGMTQENWQGLEIVLYEVANKLKTAVAVQDKIKRTGPLKMWAYQKSLHQNLNEALDQLDEVAGVLTLLQTTLSGESDTQIMDSQREMDQKLDKLIRLLQECKPIDPVAEVGDNERGKDYLRYNEKKLEFLQRQMQPIDQLISMNQLSSWGPDGVSMEDWACAWKSLEKTLELGRELIARHRTEFNLRTFYRTEDAKKGIEGICGIIRDFVRQWAPVLEELREVEVEDEIPEDAIQKDREDLNEKLDFILNGQACTFPAAFQTEWDSVRAKHQERERRLLIIRENKMKPTKKISKDMWEGLYYDSIKVTVKRVIPEGESLRLEEFAKFFAEVDIMQSMSIEFVARFIGANTSGMLVVERGEMTLMEWYKQRHMTASWPLKIKVLCEAAQGLEFVHDHGVIHRGVNSHSFLIFRGPSVKIANFSSAIQITDVRTISIRRHIGPPLWIAPEIFEGMSHSKPSDVFSFGVVMHEVAAQRHPYGMGATEADVCRKKLNGVAPCTIPGDCPPKLRTLMEECCSLEYVQRPDMSKVVGCLTEMLKEMKET